MSKINLTMTANGIKPADADSMKYCFGWKIGETRSAEIRRVRSIKHHRMIMAIASAVADNSDGWTPSSFIDAVQLTHDIHVEYSQDLNGEVFKRAKSISFGSMDETEFKQVSDKVIEEASRILKVSVQELLSNLEDV